MKRKIDKTKISIGDLVGYFGFEGKVSKFFDAINSGEILEVQERTNYGNFIITIKSDKKSKDDTCPENTFCDDCTHESRGCHDEEDSYPVDSDTKWRDET